MPIPADPPHRPRSRGRAILRSFIAAILGLVLVASVTGYGEGSSSNARADAGGSSNHVSGSEALADCLDELKKPHQRALDKAERKLRAARKDNSTRGMARARKNMAKAKAKISAVNADGREARTDLPDVPKSLSKCVFKKVSTSRFGGRHWSDHEKLIVQESSWRANAIGPSTSNGKACGIPQALPCSKMGDKSLAGQADWQMDYIAERYGDPSKAWAFHLSHNWY